MWPTPLFRGTYIADCGREGVPFRFWAFEGLEVRLEGCPPRFNILIQFTWGLLWIAFFVEFG